MIDQDLHEDEFEDMDFSTELSLKKFWLEEPDVWEKYTGTKKGTPEKMGRYKKPRPKK